MALKDLVSDLSNFNGRSQYDKLDSQIKDGVDFIPNTDAPGFTPKTDLESLYHKVKEGTVAPVGGNVKYYANLNPIGGRLSSFGDSSGRVPMKQTTPPRNNPNYDANNYPYNSKWDVHVSKLTSLNIDGYTINIQPGGFSRKNPQYINIGDDALLPAPNLFDFQVFRERSRTSETPPFHSSVEAPFTNVSLPNIFSPSGYGVEFGLDGGMNLRDRYQDGSIHIFDDDTKSPIGGSVSMFADLRAGNRRIANPMLSQFSNPNKRGADNISTKPTGFTGFQTTLFLPKEISRIVEGESLIDIFNNTESDGLNIVTLEKVYGKNKSIKDLFEFKSGTFKNVPSGINDKGNFGTKEYKEVSDPYNFDMFSQPFILREPGNQWGIDGAPGGYLSDILGGFVRGAPGITGLIDRNITDKFRIGKFLLTSRGIGFLVKQYALQALNPTIESKIFNPLSIFGVVGAQDAYEALTDAIGFTGGGIMTNLSQLAEGAGDFAATIAFPIGHPERHMGGLRYEDMNPINKLNKTHGLGKKIRSIPIIGKKLFGGINKKIADVGGFSRLGAQANMKFSLSDDKTVQLELKDRLLLMNPNKYLFSISSAPISIQDGIPKFTIEPGSGVGSTAASDAMKVEMTKKVGTTQGGVTFNKKAGSRTGTSDRNRISYHTSTYYDLVRENGYETNLRMPARNEDDTKSTYYQTTGDRRSADKKINDSIGNPGKSAMSVTASAAFSLGGGITKTNTGNIISDAVDKVNIIPYGSRTKGLEGGHKPELAEATADFIKFSFRDVVNGKWIIFRAILDGIVDTITPEFGEERYIGRPDKVYIYQGTDRSISFNFKIYPKTKQELPVLLEKLNYLVGLCYPSHTEGNRMVTPLMQLTIGDMFKDATGLLGGLTVTVEEATTWEIDEGLQFPHYISCGCEFKYIGDNILDSRGKHYGLSWLPDGSDLNERYKPGGKGLNFNDYPDRGPKLEDGKDYKTNLFADLNQG